MNNQKTPKELIVLVRKKNGKKCEDLSPSCGENVKLCNDEVGEWMGLLKFRKFRIIHNCLRKNVQKHVDIAKRRKRKLRLKEFGMEKGRKDELWKGQWQKRMMKGKK